MFLEVFSGDGVYLGFPRMRGDVPSQADLDLRVREFSPHARGCS